MRHIGEIPWRHMAIPMVVELDWLPSLAEVGHTFTAVRSQPFVACNENVDVNSTRVWIVAAVATLLRDLKRAIVAWIARRVVKPRHLGHRSDIVEVFEPTIGIEPRWPCKTPFRPRTFNVSSFHRVFKTAEQGGRATPYRAPASQRAPP